MSFKSNSNFKCKTVDKMLAVAILFNLKKIYKENDGFSAIFLEQRSARAPLNLLPISYFLMLLITANVRRRQQMQWRNKTALLDTIYLYSCTTNKDTRR